MTTQETCVEEKKETNSMQEERDVSNRHGGETPGGSVWTTAHTYGRREAVEKCGEQPREPRGKRARQEGSQGEKGRNGRREEKKATQTSCTSYSTCKEYTSYYRKTGYGNCTNTA